MEEAFETDDYGRMHDAIARIILLYGMTMCIGGLPLIYLGDEVGLCNDYTYTENPAKQYDSRWVHRPATNWELNEKIMAGKKPEYVLFEQLRKLINIRKKTQVFGDNFVHLIDTGHASVLGFVKTLSETANSNRSHGDSAVLVLANFREKTSDVILPNAWTVTPLRDMISGKRVAPNEKMVLAAYQLCWLQVDTSS